MEPVALTRTSELIHITDRLDKLGASPEEVLEQAGLPMWHFCSPDDLIPTRHISAVMEQAARSLGSPILGLLVGADDNLASLGSLGRLVASAPNTRQAFETSCRLIHTHSYGARIWLSERGDEVWFCRDGLQGPASGRRQMEQFFLMQLIEHVRMAAGPAWRPAKLCLQTQETPPRALREALGDPEIRIAQRFTAIAVPRALLAQPLQRRSASACNNYEVETRLRQTAPAEDYVDSLQQLAATLLNVEGAPRIETMAEITGLSVRTLQRRLAKNGLSHFEIVDQARYQAATRLLGASQIRITDIGMDLGYANSAHFTRAFKRWAGVTPSAYRELQMAA